MESPVVFQVYFDIDLSLLFAAINMALALIMGAIIGSERQFRGRMAGLRTNALVSLGAAGFVTFAALFPDDINPTRVAAQVVSGIGFLGAGIIFRDGFNIQGINTAATLWCSAAVGLICGAGYIPFALVLTAFIVFANLGLRPIVRKLKSAAAENAPTEQQFQLTFSCPFEDETEIRAVLIGHLGDQDLTLCQIESRRDKDTSLINVEVSGLEAAKPKVEHTISQMSLDPRIHQAGWRAVVDDENS
jgi:putative Mg2+ transporter-C (MgtC) family protein